MSVTAVAASGYSSPPIARVPRSAVALRLGQTDHVTPPSSLRPCLCPCTPGTRPPCARRTWDRGRRSIPDTRGTHSPRGRDASSTRYAPCSPSSSGCQLCSSAPLIKNESQRVHRTVSPSRGSAYPSNEASHRLQRGSRQFVGPPRAPAPQSAGSSRSRRRARWQRLRNLRHGSAYRQQFSRLALSDARDGIVVLAVTLVEDAPRLSDCILDHARIFLDLFNRRALGQQLDGDMAKLDLGRETPR